MELVKICGKLSTEDVPLHRILHVCFGAEDLVQIPGLSERDVVLRPENIVVVLDVVVEQVRLIHHFDRTVARVKMGSHGAIHGQTMRRDGPKLEVDLVDENMVPILIDQST